MIIEENSNSQKNSKGSNSRMLNSMYKFNSRVDKNVSNVSIPRPKRVHHQSSNLLQKVVKEITLIKKTTQTQKKQEVAKDTTLPKKKQQTQKKQEVVKKNRFAGSPLCTVLSYLLNEHTKQDKTEVSHMWEWEIEQIGKGTLDSKLGDLMIKLPNPDHLPQQYLQKYPNLKEESEEMQLTLQESLGHYRTIFRMQESANFLTDETEEAAFIIAYFMLGLQAKDKKLSPDVEIFLSFYEFYLMVHKLRIEDYLKLKKQKKLLAVQERLPKQVINRLQRIINKVDTYKNINQQFTKLMNQIYDSLKGTIKEESIVSLKITSILMYCPSICELLYIFPFLIQKIIRQAISAKRKYCKGESLSRVVSGNHLVWRQNSKYPRDVMTLLRKMIEYRLTVRANLFVRCFLSNHEQYIYMVIKTSEEVMEVHAQKIKMKTQVQLGATDLFSFEPLDNYFRPLRVNPYIRDKQFIRKYHLNKKDKDHSEGLKSVQSQAANYYKKAQNMNPDQLRAKIILDQVDADEAYEWVSTILDIQYIAPHDILWNQYNNEQPSRSTWQAYYLYNKLIIEFIKKAKALYNQYKGDIQNNIGMLLRLMFLKALYICDQAHNTLKQQKGIVPNGLKTFWKGNKILFNLWDKMNVEVPSGHWSYIRTKKQRIWRKYQVNELKGRSKFYPSERTMITDKIVQRNINKARSIAELHIIDYYPLHDPYILKGIKIVPYLTLFQTLYKNHTKQKKIKEQNLNLGQTFNQYECPYSASDFTKQSVEQRLQLKFSKITEFAFDSIRYYCGQKIALYFEFIRFLSVKALPVGIVAFFLQILLWVQQSHIQQVGSSGLTLLNNVLIFIFTIINIIWTTVVVQSWKRQQIKFGHLFDVIELSEQDQKRSKFEGSFKRNYINDQMNYEYVPLWKVFLKTQFTLLLIFCYVVFVVLLIMLVFIFKSYLFQKGFSQTLVNGLPSLTIAVVVQMCNYIFTVLMSSIADFQNHKTISSYQSSLASKSYMVALVLRFYSIFIYAFFSTHLDVEFICRIRTQINTIVYNCDYFVSDQLRTFVILDFFTTVGFAFVPLLKFKWKEFRRRAVKEEVKMAPNIFHAIDNFYEEQDHMETYMYNHEIDSSWQGYLNIISKLTALSLFAPAFPFCYFMLFIGGIFTLHTSKYEIIFMSRRSVPIKTKSINIWLTIMEILSLLSIIINLMYIIYTRKVFVENRSVIFFALLIIFVIFKYYLMLQYDKTDERMSKRNHIKMSQLLRGKGRDSSNNIPQTLNTDIQNVHYDETLIRKFPKMSKANVKPQAYKNQ